MKPTIGAFGLLIVTLGFPCTVEAQFRFRSIEADPDKTYMLTEDHGPWMIMMTSFHATMATSESREDLLRKAKDLVLEIRRELKIPAFMYLQRSDFGKDLPPTRWRRPRQTSWRLDGDRPIEEQVRGASHKRESSPEVTKVREFDQVAVLAGNYATLDQARKVLDTKVRHWFPKTIRRMAIKIPSKATGPFWRAFVTPNPAVPKNYLHAQQKDNLLLEMNNGPLSLYGCPGKYSVVVATFAGRTYVAFNKQKLDKFINDLETKDTDRLERAAVDAMELAKALRKHGWQAYVFHDRNSSIVAVGSFNTANDPWLQKTITTFAAVSGSKPGTPAKYAGQIRPKRLGKWQFNHRPLPITVPRSG